MSVNNSVTDPGEDNRYRLIIENTSDLISSTTFSPNPLYTYISPSFKRVLGYDSKDLIGENNLDYIHPDDKKNVISLLKKYLTKKTKGVPNGKPEEIVERFECRLRDKEGKWHYVESTANIIGKEILFVSKDITEKKVMVQKIKESEERYRDLIDSSEDSIYVLDHELRHLLVNDAATKFVKMSKDQLLGNSLLDLFPGFEKTPFYKTFKKVLRSRKTDNIVNRFVFPDGTIGYYDVSITPVKEGILCISRDITKQKQIEEKLLVNEMKYRSYVESAPDGVFVCDDKGRYLEVNDAAVAITGYTKKELTSLSIKDMLPEESSEAGLEHFKTLIKTGRSNGTLLYKKKDGSKGYWNIASVKLTDTTFLGFTKDVTDIVEMQRNLRESEEKYRGVVDNIGMGVSLLSKDLNILFLNNQLETWFSSTDVSKKPLCYEIFNNPPRDSPCTYCPTILTLQDGKVHESIRETSTQNGIVNYRIVSSPIFNDDGTVDKVIESFEDITIQKQAEDKLKQLNKELDIKVKERTETIEQILKQKDEFINQLGHDLKNPIGPILNLVPLLDKKTDRPEDKEILQVILRNALYMKNLITKIIKLAQLNSPNTTFNFEDVNLATAFNEELTKNKMLFDESQIKTITKIPTDIIISADRLHLQELITNLLSNAVKYSKENGMITVSSHIDDSMVIISVQDTGIGMTNEQMETIFEEFTRIDTNKETFKSSGLGLSIAKRIVQRHGGQIWVESDGLGKGSTFSFSLPLSKKTEEDQLVTTQTINT